MVPLPAPRPMPFSGPYFRDMVRKAEATKDPWDRLAVFQEYRAVGWGSKTGGCTPVVHKDLPGGYDSLDDVIRDLKTLAKQGNPRAVRTLIDLQGGPEAVDRALKADYEAGDPYATVKVLYPRTGIKRTPGEEGQFKDAIAKLEHLAEGGDRKALYTLATYMPDRSICDPWFEKMMAAPDRLAYKAMTYRAWYCPGPGAFDADGLLLLEAANRGDAGAMLALADHYYYGDERFKGLETQNLDQAWMWMRRFRKAMGCLSPDEDPPNDDDTGEPWKKPRKPDVPPASVGEPPAGK